ncbi:hydroxyacylglutathione hydrolase [Pseudomonas mosselii]|uniref:hydroxyacylglutathione hydrolase n=1 Tax=Pseudomonas mosselii TaxID=78327 RepID=UPI00244AB954|nr:hydroxyacylglutathione hydrolase [Pseudomonas mosselii]MDH0630054.1 hydroxyacylglutathione hydrolase [Pseudomonas mosselii]MDH0679130.1 hydroxyacylglutathione hydrolase [Pseudomonas mosselii]MDH0927878.1 hydroxyacylglutathione hydrolase [Pseudomonas mosselii]MDH1135629.1 hydroxyacylglutathione hydrolase [Pseudomonas mosselii]MDH1139047.1 hydroxyacylglutathione hydrolase [Pseudomonas mosselii]
MIQIDALPAFNDNYIWLLQDTANRRCAVVDPGDAGPVLAWLGQHPDWVLEAILVTHHHHDHVGGVEALKQASGATVYGPASERIPGRDVALEDGAQFQALGLTFEVMAMPGHTLGHIAYYTAQSPTPLLFSGDTLFAAGCGRLFEGTPEQMHHSLQRLAALPAETEVYCAHEYTLSNLRFARAVEPENPHVLQRFEDVTRLRADNRISLPSTIGLERLTNPFLRTAETFVKQKADEWKGHSNPTQATVFAALRSWKDVF